MAADGVNRCPIAPPLAGHLADNAFAPGGHGIGDFLAQIEITTDTFVVRAAEGEDRLGIGEVYGIFDLAAAVDTFRIKKLQIDRQGFQLLKFFCETDRVLDADGFLQAVFRTGTGFLMMHIVLIRPLNWGGNRLAGWFDTQDLAASRLCLRMARRWP
jgi:hypothetical protein